MTNEDLELENEMLQNTIGRFATENSHLRRSTKRHYEAQRRLENAIRKHSTGACKCRSAKQCMNALSRLIPVNPRPIYKSRVRTKVSK